MRYSEVQPNAVLAPFVECFWILEGEGDSETASERILPDGCVEIILNFADRFRELRQGCEDELQPQNFLVGQMTQPIFIRPTGPVALLGIRFQPGGTFPFLRIPMHETTNQVIELGAISGRLKRELLAAADESPSLQEKVRAIERVLLTYVRNCRQGSRLVELTAKIVRSAGRASIDTLAADAGVSARQLRRRFLLDVGVGPKFLCRLLRFQQVFRAVDLNEAQWTAVALECGYYDQAHLINDFRQFAHETPAVLFARPTHLTEAFTRKNRTSDFSNTSVISPL